MPATKLRIMKASFRSSCPEPSASPRNELRPDDEQRAFADLTDRAALRVAGAESKLGVSLRTEEDGAPASGRYSKTRSRR